MCAMAMVWSRMEKHSGKTLGDVFLRHSVFGGFGGAQGTDLTEHVLIIALTLFSVVEYIAFGIEVVREFCATLDIWCFTIKHPKVDRQGKLLTSKE